MERSIEILTEILDKVAEEQDYLNYHIDIQSASENENNYTTFLYQVTLKSQGKDVLVLDVKVPAPDLTMRAILPFFEMEYFFYDKLLRKYKLLEDKNNILPEHRLVTPKFYYGSDEYLKEILVLEDLTAKGFVTNDNLNFIDWEYASKSLENLAKFHALSIALSEDDLEGFQNFTILSSNIDSTGIESIIEYAFSSALQVVKEENRSLLKRIFVQLFKRNDKNKYYMPHSRAFIIHCNYRPSNLMHRKLDGHLEVIAVNYQMLSLGNPIVDIVYLIFIGSNKKFRDKYLKRCLEHYYAELCKALIRFGLDPAGIYPREDFDNEVEQVLPLGLYQSLCSFMTLFVDKEVASGIKLLNLEDITASQKTLYVERINDVVDDFIEKGYVKFD
ncbi:ecdysteroid 22-kinase [Danaus plexippus plexippus]|uniref:Ecdysteroid 22-kinase n=1 Tax=Danaus plexippus plexippus TaxID=278856 RepID=A0A212EPI2_DANPL|nr:ecdysteroid 22-kinase [Danaus plexippus plexippus]